MSHPHYPSKLQLNPGAPRRKSRLAVCSVLKALFVVGCLGIVYFIASGVYSGVRSRRAPHSDLYQDPDVPYKHGDVVRPLLDAKQTFSVVATVWIRDSEFGGEDGHSVGSADAKVANDIVEGGPVLHERVIFSDTIFRDLRLESKTRDVQTAVNLKIPTSVFLSPKLWNYDLRASFVIIPDTPSPLDHAANYSSWIPNSVHFPSVRYWPDGEPPSTQDRIVDSYGAFIPLIAFMPINSTCPKTSKVNKGEQNMVPKPELQENSEDDTDDMDIPVPKQPEHSRANFIKSYTFTDSRSVLDAHPYIVTRSHLRVVDMVRLYNRTAYEKHHRELQLNSCGQRIVDGGLSDWRLCRKDFSTNANGETRVRLRSTDSNSQKSRTEWAYGPYLSLFESAWGPLDLVEVPVKREKCNDTTIALPNIPVLYEEKMEDTHMDVQWNVVLSIVSPGQLFLADSMALIMSVYNMKSTLETEAERQKIQSRLEYSNALGGHKFNEDSHPRRHSALYVINIITSFISGFLALHYWLTRTSTVGISTQGGALSALASLIHVQIMGSVNRKKKQSVSEWVFVLIIGRLPFALKDIFILKAISRAELDWYKKWIPIVRISPATHLERASARVEARIPWLYKALAFVMLSAAFSYNRLLSFFSLAPFDVDAEDSLVASGVTFPAITLSLALQLFLNSRSKTFAGLYRLNAPLLLLRTLLGVAQNLPLVVGNVPSAKGVTLFETIKLVLHLLLTYQAAIYSSVNYSEEEDQSTR